MAKRNTGNDPPAADQNTPDQTTREQQHQDVMTHLAEMRQDANAATTAMQQWMDATTRQLQLGLHVRIYPPFDPNRSGALEQRWDMGLSDMPLDDQRRFHTYIGTRIAAAENATTQTLGSEDAAAPSQARQGDASGLSTAPDRTDSQVVNHSHSLPDDAVPLNTTTSRVRRPGEELRQTGARQTPVTSAAQSNTAPSRSARMQPSTGPGQASSTAPEVRAPAVQEPPSHQPTMNSSDKGKGTAVDRTGRKNLDRSGASRNRAETDELSNTIPSSDPKPKISRQTSTSNLPGSANPRTGTRIGRRNTVADTQGTGLGSLDASIDDWDEKQRKNSRYGLRQLGAVKKEKTPEYESDHDMDPVKGYVWIKETPKPKNINDDAPQDATSRETKGITTAGNESTEGTQNSTLMPPKARGRTKSSPSLTGMVARSGSINAPRVPGNAETDRFDDDERPRKHRKADDSEDVEDEPEDDNDASSSPSEEDGDDGHGAQIGDRRPSNSSDAEDASRDVAQSHQRAGRSTSHTAQGDKGQRVERQGNQHRSSTKTRARGPQSDEDNESNDDTQNQDTSQRLERPSGIGDTDAVDTLYGLLGSGDDGDEPGIPDEQFDQLFGDDKNPGPTDQDRVDEEAEEYNDPWEDGGEAKNADEAHVFSKRPKNIVKHSNGRRPTTGYGSRHGSSATSWIPKSANDGNIGDDRPARTGEKRKSNSSTQGEEADGKFLQLCTPQ
jgi:hypothetical protein